MKEKKFIFFIFLILLIFLVGCSTKNSRPTVTIYKTPNCGCCVGYSSYLESNNYNVNLISINELSSIKEKYNIPKEMESCHTMIVGDYFVEGHVPIEIVEKLVNESPDIDGISLPRMPAGSPGMPGEKIEPFTIYSLNDGKEKVYIKS